MDIAETAERCVKIINTQVEKPSIAIVTPSPWKPPKGFPRRTLLCVNRSGEHVYRVRADKLLEWMAKNQLIEVRYGPSDEP